MTEKKRITVKRAVIKHDAEADLAALSERRDEKAELEEAIATLQGQLIEDMMRMETKSLRTVRSDGIAVTGALVASSSFNVDEQLLKKALGSAMWEKVSTRQLDRRKLDAFMKSGEVDPLVVAQCSNDVPRSPYIRITKK